MAQSDMHINELTELSEWTKRGPRCPLSWSVNDRYIVVFRIRTIHVTHVEGNMGSLCNNAIHSARR